jgi:hypothetical protein
MSEVLLAFAALIGFVVLVFATAGLVALWIGRPAPRRRRRGPDK